jgi:PAS domain S-box-containing protein
MRNLQSLIQVFPFIVAASLALILAWRTWRSDDPGGKTGAVILIAITIWSLSEALEVVSPTLSMKILWDKISFFGIVIIPNAWLVYVLQNFWKDRQPSVRVLGLLLFPSLIVLILALTNESHGLLLDRLELKQPFALMELPKVYSIGLKLFAGYSYLVIFAGIAFLLHLLIRSRQLYKWQATALILVCLAPFVANILEVFGFIELPRVDLTIIILAITVPLIIWLIRRLRFGEIRLVAWGEVIKSMSDAIIILDAQEVIVDLNPAASLLIGDASKEAIGNTLTSAWPMYKNYSETIPINNERGIEVPTNGEGGKIYDMRISPLLDWRKQLVSKIIVLRDISELKNIEKLLRTSNLKLETTLAELKDEHSRIVHQERLATAGQLTAGIAHDFNNTLWSIALYSEAMLGNSLLDENDRSGLNTIIKQAQIAAKLTQQILDFNRISLGQIEPINMAEFLEESIDLLKQIIPEKITIQYQHSNYSLFIEADPSRIQHILLNLAFNARDAMPDGGELTFKLSRIHVGKEKPPPEDGMASGIWIMLRVIDNGIGIPPEHIDKIFEPFFTTKDVGQGTGLGLAQVYEIVKQQGGFIHVESLINEGTDVVIYFPEYCEKTDN